MSLINLKNVSVAFGADPILDQANLVIESNERIGLIGRNGAGKSTLLKMIDSKVLPDDGELLIQQGTIVGRLVQEVPSDLDFDIRSVVALGDDTLGQALADYYLAGESDIDTQTIVTELEAWGLDVQVKTLCSRFDLDPEAQFCDLSGGMKRRVLMARALVKQPDILLLDEPTNHLDIETILWLETLLIGLNVTMIIISHDRSFIDKLSTRIIEIDRGLITSYPGNFQTYLATKAKALEDEDVVNAKFDKRLAQEEVWIRKGIQARRTRNEGRVRALKQMRDDRSQRRERQGTANISLNAGGGKSGKVVIEAESLRASFDGRVIMRDFSCRILRGDKVGIIGPNGCGKSTLIKILTGENQPHGGKIKIGTNLEIAYLDQHRSEIRDDLSVQDNVSGNNEITINGQTKHIMGYLQDFLFSPSRARAPAAKLSGGERNRLMLAKLFTKPFNFLVLDEPTNDLDYETLELLEQLLMDYTGTLLLVSHDRTFLDNVVTSTIAFEGDGEVHEYIGGYEDWLRQKRDNSEKTEPTKKKQESKAAAPKAKKLSYNLQRELEQLPKEIDKLEKKIESITLEMAKPEFYQQDKSIVSRAGNNLKELQEQLDKCFVRWEELES
ncbi:MAG: ATP-binding cassette subfamily F protein uup [Arenicella sp.]|jgi:ATP-binding cassette subfamily F protein uup